MKRRCSPELLRSRACGCRCTSAHILDELCLLFGYNRISIFFDDLRETYLGSYHCDIFMFEYKFSYFWIFQAGIAKYGRSVRMERPRQMKKHGRILPTAETKVNLAWVILTPLAYEAF